MGQGTEAPLGSFEAAELADDVELELGPDRLKRSTAGPGRWGASRRPQDDPGSPVPPDPTPRGPGAGWAPLHERPIEALPAPYSDMDTTADLDPPGLGRVAPVRRVLDASTTPAGPDSGGAGRIASAPTPTWPAELGIAGPWPVFPDVPRTGERRGPDGDLGER